MVLGNEAFDGRDDLIREVELAKIEFINSNRINSVTVMSLSAILVYAFATLEVVSPIFTWWLVLVLCIDAFRMSAVYMYNQDKKYDRVDIKKSERNILIGTILSACCWGSLGFILLPVVGSQTLMIILMLLIVLATASTTTLSFQFRLAAMFVIIVLVQVMIGLLLQSHIVGSHLLLVEIGLIIIIIFLIKNARVFSQNFEHMLLLQAKSHEHEEQLMLQSERADIANRAKSEFLANMSHELRTPMHAILGFSSLGSGKVGTATNEKIVSYFTRINESGQRLLLLLNDLLDLSKLEAGRMKYEFSENDLQLTVHNVVEELNPLFLERSLTIDIEPACAYTYLEYDSDKIEQVVRNLLSNAIKYTPDGMSVLIYYNETRLPPREDPRESQDLAESVPAISVSIMDQGSGIPEDELETVFNKFVQSSNTNSGAGGTGLGLSISKEIIEGHGGTLVAGNSTGEGGAIFTFTLPYTQIKHSDD